MDLDAGLATRPCYQTTPGGGQSAMVRQLSTKGYIVVKTGRLSAVECHVLGL